MIPLPLYLYNIDNELINRESVSTSNNYFIRSYKNFTIRVIGGICKIYSVELKLIDGVSTPIATESDSFIGESINSSYTLFLESDAIVECDGIVYQIKLEIDNVINNTNEHYLDLLDNYFLPSYKELEPAMLSGSKRELLKRLLLDFKNIVSKKGTKISIEKFFNFVGFGSEKLNILEEYFHKNPDETITRTINPNKLIDYKNGDYHVLYDNFDEEKDDNGFKTLDNNNLPLRKITLENLEEFFNKLMIAIALANKYFTLQEQEITFFGLNFSANLPKFFSLTGNTSMIWEQDIYNFRKKIVIDLLNYFDSENYIYLVKNTLQKTKEVFRTEIKTYSIKESENQELYFIDREIFDDETITPDIDITKIRRVFGKVLQLDLIIPNCYVEVTITNNINQLCSIKYEKSTQLLKHLHLNFVTTIVGTFDVVVDFYDEYNNRERYFYQYEISNNITYVDFNTFNSVKILDDVTENGLIQDIDSPSEITIPDNIWNYILPLQQVPDDLSKYYNSSYINTPKLRYLLSNSRYLLPTLNKNFTLSEITDTLLTKYSDTNIEIISVKLTEELKLKKLKLRIFDVYDNRVKLIDYTQLPDYSPMHDVLFLTIMDIVESKTLEQVPYIFITTTESGINIDKLFDFVFVENREYTESEIKLLPSIYTLPADIYTFDKLPVNYDFQLFTRKSKLVPDFVYYVSNKIREDEPQIILGPKVLSLFPRLVNISKTDVQTFYVKLGDIVCCVINDDTIVNYNNIVWKVYNSFTNELLFETKEFSLKYRIDDNTCYDILLEFIINDEKYRIKKNSLFSSFDTKTIE